MGLKHAELIKAWADGADIESRIGDGEWVYKHKLMPWYEDYQYRIKPEPKPDVVEQYVAKGHIKYGGVRVAEHWEKENLKLTFDGATGKLKSAEVL